MKEKNSFDPRSNRVFFKRHPVLHYNGAALAICQALTTGVESGTFRGQDPGLLNLVYKYKYISFSRGFFVTRNRPHPSREARPPRGGGFLCFNSVRFEIRKMGVGRKEIFDAPPCIRRTVQFVSANWSTGYSLVDHDSRLSR